MKGPYDGKFRVIFFTCLGVTALITWACASPERVATSSVVRNLPDLGSRVWIWSRNVEAEETARQWIADRGLLPVNPIPQSPTEWESFCSDSCDGRAVARSLTRTKDVDYVLIVRMASEGLPGRGAVRISGISLASSSEMFHGTGWEWVEDQSHEEERSDLLRNLLCKTLATVWRYRAAGFLENESVDYCHLPRVRA